MAAQILAPLIYAGGQFKKNYSHGLPVGHPWSKSLIYFILIIFLKRLTLLQKLSIYHQKMSNWALKCSIYLIIITCFRNFLMLNAKNINQVPPKFWSYKKILFKRSVISKSVKENILILFIFFLNHSKFSKKKCSCGPCPWQF